MAKQFIDIVGPHYQDLISRCEKRKIAVNLDFQELTISIHDDDIERVDQFLRTEIKRALRNCTTGDKITLSEANNAEQIKISVKNSGAETLSADEKAALAAAGFEVRARFGYDTIVSLRLDR